MILLNSSHASEGLNPDALPFEAKRIFQKFLVAEQKIQKKLVDSLFLQIREYEKRGDHENVEKVVNFVDEYQISLKKKAQERQRAKIKCAEKFASLREGMWFSLDHPAPFSMVPEEFLGEKISMRYNQTDDMPHNDLFFEVVKGGEVFIMIRKRFLVDFETDGWEYYCLAAYGESPTYPIVILKKFLSPGKYSLPSKGAIGTRIFDL